MPLPRIQSPNMNTDDEYADMPSLSCGKCGNIASKGGSQWEAKHPSTVWCTCIIHPCHVEVDLKDMSDGTSHEHN